MWGTYDCRQRFGASVLVVTLTLAFLLAGPTSASTRPSLLRPSEAQFEVVDQSLNLVAAANGGRVVSFTDQDDYYPASNLIDGYKLDYGEWWTKESPDYPQTVVFGLAHNRARMIDEVVLNPWTSDWRYGWVKNFDIYVSSTSPRLKDMKLAGSYTLEHVGIDQSFTFKPVMAKYVALVINSNYGSQEGVGLNEFEVYEASSEAVPEAEAAPSHPGNVAASSNGGRIVAISSEDPNGNWSAAHLIDGVKDSPAGWSSAEGRDQPQYIVFGFAGNRRYLVDRIVVNPYSNGYEEDWVKDFELRGSETGLDVDQMMTLGKFTLQQTGEDQTFVFEPLTLRYLALIPLDNYGGTAFALNEVEVYKAVSGPREQSAEEKKVTLPPSVTPSETSVTLEKVPPHESASVTPYVPQRMETEGGSAVDSIDVSIAYNDLVPVTYHLYGRYFDDLVQTTLINHNPRPVKVRVESAVSAYTGADIKTLTLGAGETATVMQNPPLAPGAIGSLHENRNATLYVRVDYLREGEQRLIYENTSPLTVYSRGNFPWNVPGFHNGTVFLPTMVTPNDPAIDELLRVAADYMPGGAIVKGYQEPDDAGHSVWNRMKAIYDAVSDHYNVIYVAAGVDFVPKSQEEQGFTMQRLKLPREVLATRSGMCVETSLLFASAFENIGLRPIIVTVPGHVYVAVPISWDNSTYYFLETTMVSRYSFEEAISKGNEEFADEAKEPLASDQLDDYFWLDVQTLRDEGLVPMPWR